MTPAVNFVATSVDFDRFDPRCWAQAYLIEHGMMFLQEAVDELQDLAISTGLVDQLGHDAVQMIMARPFKMQEASR